MTCVMCLHLGTRERPVIQWYCKKTSKVISDFYSLPSWCPTNERDVIEDDV